MIGFRFGEAPVSHCYGVAGVTAPTTETVSILYHGFLMKARFLPVYIPQAKAWGFDGGVLKQFLRLKIKEPNYARKAEQIISQLEQDQDKDGFRFYVEADSGSSDQDPNSHP